LPTRIDCQRATTFIAARLPLRDRRLATEDSHTIGRIMFPAKDQGVDFLF
jgi:hypothetical protein